MTIGVSKAFLPSLILLGLSVPGLNLCMVTAVASLLHPILTDAVFFVFVYCGSSVPIETCLDAQPIQLDILALSCLETGVVPPGGKTAWAWLPQPEHEEEACLPHKFTLSEGLSPE